MRKFLAAVAVLALAGCGGGGGGTSPQSPPATQAPVPQGNLVVPQFTFVIPSRGSSQSRSPQYVSSATLSVKITLTADSAGVATGATVTDVVAAGSCNSGCTVNGPPSPPGTDSYLIVTYDNNVPASGHALNAAQLNNVTITAGQANSNSVTLGAIPATLSVSGMPSAGAFTAGTASQHADVQVTAVDAGGVTIPTGKSPAVKYVDATGTAINVTLSDPDTGMHGSCVVASGSNTCTSGAATSVTFTGPDDTKSFAYDGLAENPVTLTASASTATNGTTSFYPTLNAPVFNSAQATPQPVAQTAAAEVDLFAASGIGSTGTEYFTESGWTNSPYAHALTHTDTGACSTGTGITATSMADIATIVTGADDTTKGTPFTATVAGSPKPGSCPSVISDGLSLNSTDGSATLTVTYLTASITASSKNRHNR